MVKEKTVQNNIRDKLDEEVGGYWSKIHGGPYQRSGLPDLIGCVDGHFIGIEVKTPKRKHKVTDNQAYVLKKIEANGGTAFVAWEPEQALELVRDALSD